MTRDEILAMEAGRELDVEIAIRLFGWTWVCHIYEEPADRVRWLTDDFNPVLEVLAEGHEPIIGNAWDELPLYSQEVAAAWQVFEAGLLATGEAGISADMEDYGRGGWRGLADKAVKVWVGDEWVLGPVCEAICKAALLAVMQEGEK